MDEVRRIIADINQQFIDAEHWNTSCRKEGEEPINPDPDGQLARTKERLHGMLANEIRVDNPA